MRPALFAAALLAVAAAAPVRAGPSGEKVMTAISLSDMSELLSANGLPAQIGTVDGNPIVVADLAALGVAVNVHIAGISCGSDVYATNTTTPCQILEFVAILEIPPGVSDAAIAELDRKFELSSIERVDATHVAVSDGMVLDGGVAVDNIVKNIGFFAGQCLAAGKELAKTAGRTS